VKKANKKFSRAKAWEKRVALAKDVITQIKAKLISAKTGNYISLDYIDYYIDFDSQFNKAVKEKKLTCQTCAKGALLACHVLKNNHMTIRDASRAQDEDVKPRLKRIFGKGQLDLIEAAFEKAVICDDLKVLEGESNRTDQFGNYYNIPTELGKKAIAFGKKYRDANKRLIAIMENIITNRGTFIP
jgi:ribosomal protein S27AE